MNTKKVQNIKFSLDKLKGTYSGDALTNILGSIPEGYGVATFEGGPFGDFSLEGRFKEGNFVSGIAKCAGGTYRGEFDNLRWLGGADGRIDFPNGDYLKGTINPFNKKLVITQLKYTQNNGEILTAQTQKDKSGKEFLKGKLTYKNGSVIEGIFEQLDPSADPIIPNYSDYFGIKKGYYACTNGKAQIIIKNSDSQKACISGTIQTNKNNNTAKITGAYTFDNFREGISIVATGDFDYSRSFEDYQKDNISEDFSAELNIENPANDYATILNLQGGGKIAINTPAGTLHGTKYTERQMYQGTMINKDGSFQANGIFDQKLSLVQGDVIIKNPSESFSVNYFVPKKIKTEQDVIQYTATANGVFVGLNFKKEGSLLATIETELDSIGLVVSAKYINPQLISGKIYLKQENGAIFDAELLSLQQKTDLLASDALFNTLSINYNEAIYQGSYILKTSDDKKIFDKNGFFDKDLNFILGQLYSTNIRDTDLTFFGTYHQKTGFDGILSAPNGDYQEGRFDNDLQFSTGKVRKTYPNRAIFEGEILQNKRTKTNDLLKGVLERKNEFREEGEFLLNEENYPILSKGKVLVFFDTPDNAYCKAQFDQKGFELFDGKKYICNFKSDLNPEGVAVAEDNITDAYSKFLEYTKKVVTVNGEYTKEEFDLALALAQHQIIAKYQTQDTPLKVEAEQLVQEQTHKQTIYQDAVDIAGEITDVLDTQTKEYDIANAQSIMTKIINPNKPQQFE